MEANSLNDADLVAQTLAGNRESFGELYDRYARMVRAVVAGVSGDWPSAEDMTQECFLRGYRNLSKLREPERFGPWIVGIARQVGRERRRSLARDRHEFRDARIAEMRPTSDGEVAVDEREHLEAVMQKLTMLPEQERVAVHSFFLEQQDARQAAQLLGLSRSGFYAVVARGIARLAKQMRPDEKSQEKGSKQ
jgi:RNA polymerase sigma-70 factor (ECF subfamily)